MERVNNVFQFTDDFTYLVRPAFLEVRPRRAPREHEDRLHQPAQRRHDVLGRHHRQRDGRLPARPARAGARHHHAGDPGRPRLALRRLRAGRVPRLPAADPEPRRPLRAAAPVRGRERRDHRRSTPACSRRRTRPRPPGSCTRATRAFRAAWCRPTRTTSRRGWPRSGTRPASGRTSVRAAWGIFYDALAGQGDFFQSGVLSPPFTPLVELNTPTPITLREPAAARSAGGPRLFPPNLTIIGWGNDFQSPYAHHFNLTVQQQIGQQPRRRDRLRRLARQTHADLHGDQPRRVRARADGPRRAHHARVLAAAADVLGGRVLVRRAAGERAPAPHARPELPGLLHLEPHASTTCRASTSAERRGPSCRSRRATRPASTPRSPSRRATRCSTCGTASCSASATSCRGWQDKSALVRNVLGGWQLNGIFQAQTGFPLTVNEGANLDIRYLTARPDVTCDPNDGPKTRDAVVRHELLPAPLAGGDAASGPATQGRNTVRGPGFNRTDLSLFKNFEVRQGPRAPAPRGGVQPVQPGPLRPAGGHHRHRHVRRRSRARTTGGSSSSASSTFSR